MPKDRPSEGLSARKERMAMREPLARHQSLEYEKDLPFYIVNVCPAQSDEFYVKNSHWHEELELAYSLNSIGRHYIDGVCVPASPGRLIVTNSESVHRFAADGRYCEESETDAIVLLIQKRFLDEHFPEYQSFYFTNDKLKARPEIHEIMLKLSAFAAQDEIGPHDHLYVKGLVLQLLYYMCEEGTVSRDNASVTSKSRNRLKDVMKYIELHYNEPLVQADVARHFYFTKEYFSRYFRQSTGITFTEYVMQYRTQMARRDLLSSDKRVVDIALENGFSDERRLISAFKKFYHITPLQYRKSLENPEKALLPYERRPETKAKNREF